MDDFVVQSTSGSGSLTFFDRIPDDPARPIEAYSVRLVVGQLSAACQVYADVYEPGPVSLFEQMAERWRGWDGELVWGNFDVLIYCAQDRAGHVAIRVEMNSIAGGWTASGTSETEAGQLDRLARRASLWFGRPGEPSDH